MDKYQLHYKLDAQFLKDFPNYCQKCDGYGGKWHRYDPSPPGIALASGYMEDFEPCKCVEEGRCPRCGVQWPENFDTSDTFICPECFWNVEDPEGRPQAPEPEWYEDADY